MPESLGHTLEKIRKSKNLSREEVCERTRIPKNIISAIEEDKLSEIKSPFYAKSFVRTYSGFLGALGETAVKEFLVGEGLKPSPTSVIARSPLPVIASPLAMTAINKYKNQIITVIAGILLFWILSMAVGQVAKLAKKIHDRKQVKSAVIKKEVVKKPEKEKPVEVKKEIPEKKPDQIEISVTAEENTWLQVICDGDILFKGLFKKGNKDVWKAKKEIRFEAGNSGAVQLNVNGKPAGPIGKKGEKKEIIITKDGIKN